MSGYTAKILRVDLTKEQITEENVSEDILKQHVGGEGLGARFLYQEVPPGADWNDAENRLIFATGPLNSSRIAGSGSYCAVSKGPLTNGAASSQANGFFGAYLKFAGYQAIIVQGKAKKWSYLLIDGSKAELKNAEHLLGKDTWETEDLIKAELGKKENEMSVVGIGPAGENLVKFAAIVGDKGHVAGHNGLGAVLGSKKLKAVAVARGKSTVIAADKDRLASLSQQMNEEYKKNPQYIWGTSLLYSNLHGFGLLPIKNLTTSIFPKHPQFMGEKYRGVFEEVKRHPCWACSAQHSTLFKVVNGPYAGFIGEEPEYEGWAGGSSVIGQEDVETAFVIANTIDRLGMEINEASWLMAFVIECFEKGIITKKETGGLKMNWGDAEAVLTMLRLVAARQGIGDVLAEGLMRASQKLGAPDLGVYLKKGVAPRGHDHRGRWAEMFDVATSNTGTMETGPMTLADDFSPDLVSTSVATQKGVRSFIDSLVVCTSATMTYRVSKIDHLVNILNAVTGWDFTVEDAKKTGVRTANLLRAFNIRQGITTDVEFPSARYCSAPVDGPVKGKSVAPYWNQMLDNYYQKMGWDRASGKPLPETLRKLNLDYVIPDIWK